MKALLPALNSPAMTSKKRSSSWLYRRGQRGLIVGGGAEPGQRVAQGREQVACVYKLSFGSRVENAQHFMRLTQNPVAAEWVDVLPSATETTSSASFIGISSRRTSSFSA